MYRVYGDALSGNCYKVQLMLHLLNIEHEWVHVDILAGETQTDEFKQKNANGKIPLLQTSNNEFLSESNAILNFFAYGTQYLPDEPMIRAKVLQWQFFEQYSHEPYIAVARYINKYLGLPEERIAEYQSKQQGGHKALAVMEHQLAQSPFIAGGSFTIADISLFAYTHVAHEGGFAIEHYPHILSWCSRVKAQSNFVAMQS